jgi:hypothetical protein
MMSNAERQAPLARPVARRNSKTTDKQLISCLEILRADDETERSGRQGRLAGHWAVSWVEWALFYGTNNASVRHLIRWNIRSGRRQRRAADRPVAATDERVS